MRPNLLHRCTHQSSRLLLRGTALSILALAFVPSLRAETPKLDTMPIFKESVGSWKGKGTSEVGFQKTKLEVTDDWKGAFEKDGAAFVQSGKVTLSNGTSFQYRWLYEFDPKTQKLSALYTDSKRARSRHAVEVDPEAPKLTVSPVNASGQPQTAGLFSTVEIKDGQQVYEAQVRNNMGDPVIKTTVTSVKEGKNGEAAP